MSQERASSVCRKAALIPMLSYGVALLAGSAVVGQETTGITLEQIEQAWRERGRRFVSGRISLSVTKFLAKGAISGSSAGGPYPMKKGGGVPPHDVTRQFTRSVTFDGNKLRYSDGEPVWYDPINDFHDGERVSVFDGQAGSLLYPNVGSGAFPFLASVRPDAGMIGGMLPLRPLLGHFCPELSAIDRLARYRITAEREEFGGATCLVLTNMSERGLRETLWLDRDSGFIERKRLRKFGEVVRSQCEVSYRLSDEHGYLPSGWTRLEYGSDGVLEKSVKTEINHLELNVPIDGSQFRIEFPAGTLVEEMEAEGISRGPSTYLVLSDGQRRPVTREELLREGVTPEILAATKPGEAGLPTKRRGLFWVWAMAGVVLLALYGVLVAWKRHWSVRQ